MFLFPDLVPEVITSFWNSIIDHRTRKTFVESSLLVSKHWRHEFIQISNTNLHAEFVEDNDQYINMAEQYHYGLVKTWKPTYNALRRPFGHRMNGITFTIFGKEHDFLTKLTLAHMQMPFLTVIDEEARQAYRTVPLIGKWENLRLKEAEYGLCGHDFATLLGMAQLQRFYYDVDKDTYKVHIMYTSSQGDPADTAIIVTAIVPGHFLDGLEEEPPVMNPDGLTFTRNTVQLPRPDQEAQDCELFKALMFIIDENFKVLDPFIHKDFRVGEKYAYIYDYSSPAH